MPAKRPPLPGTLAAYAECGRPVFIVCNGCGRYVAPRFYLIARETGWAAMVSEIGKRMRCSGCGHRGATFTTDQPPGRMSKRL